MEIKKWLELNKWPRHFWCVLHGSRTVEEQTVALFFILAEEETSHSDYKNSSRLNRKSGLLFEIKIFSKARLA